VGGLEAEVVLLFVLAALGDGFTDNLQSSVLGEGVSSLVGSGSLRNTEESLILIVIPDELEEELESALGGFRVDFINGGGPVVQRLNHGLLTSDGEGCDVSLADVSSRFDGVSLCRVRGVIGRLIGRGGRSRAALELGSPALSKGEEDGVGLALIQIQGEVVVLVEEVIPGVGGSGWFVGFHFEGEFHTQFFTTQVEFLLLWASSADDFEVFVFLRKMTGPWILNDGGVWNLIVGNDADVSLGLSIVVQVGGSDGNLDSFVFGLLGNNSEWEFDSQVLFITDLVVSHGVWDFGSETSLELTNKGQVDISVDALLRALTLKGNLSNGGNDDWEVHAEGDGESQAGGHFTELFNGLDGLLHVDLLNLSTEAVGARFRFLEPNGNNATNFGRFDNIFQTLSIQFGVEVHLIPKVDLGVDIGLLPDI